MPHIWYWECLAHRNMANLSSFPFKNTNCKTFSPVGKELKPDKLTGLMLLGE
jgi:hypothetical protein